MTSNLLPRGQQFRMASGTSGSVGEVLGRGGQGTVYAVDCSGRRLAMKWYHLTTIKRDVTLRDRIARMIRQPPPDNNFVWPIDWAEIPGVEGFGYVMPIISKDRRPLQHLFGTPPDQLNLNLDLRGTSCLEIATSFQRLHATGYCYQDINFGGFFVDPLRGTIQICDADNISIDGQLGGVYGTRKFMAPEVLRQKAIPSTLTDLYSMAVLFFYMIFNWHPLDGRKMLAASASQSNDLEHYGLKPLFIFDPNDESNGPVQGTHDWIVARWAAITETLRQLFLRAFTIALMQPSARPVEAEWRAAFDQLRNAVVACPRCGFEHGVDQKHIDRGITCVACGTTLTLPPLLQSGRDPILLRARRKVFDYQLRTGVIVDNEPPLAQVDCHPANVAILGLQNLSPAAWGAFTPPDRNFSVAPSKTVRVVDGLDVDFGSRHGVVSNASGATQYPSDRTT